MRKVKLAIWFIVTLSLSIVWSGCSKKYQKDPKNNFSYKIGIKNYNYPYSTSSMLFGGIYRSIDARQISGGFTITTNYTETTHNTIDMLFINTINDLPNDYYAVSDENLIISMEDYRGPHGDFFVLDKSDKDGYIKFDHISEEYIEGSFSFKMIRADQTTRVPTSPKKSILLKNGKFRIEVY